MTIALFKVVRNEDFNESENGLSFTGELIPATPEEIKGAHGKCGTCKQFEDEDSPYGCGINKILYPEPTDYCNHHEPKET